MYIVWNKINLNKIIYISDFIKHKNQHNLKNEDGTKLFSIFGMYRSIFHLVWTDWNIQELTCTMGTNNGAVICRQNMWVVNFQKNNTAYYFCTVTSYMLYTIFHTKIQLHLHVYVHL